MIIYFSIDVLSTAQKAVFGLRENEQETEMVGKNTHVKKSQVNSNIDVKQQRVKKSEVKEKSNQSLRKRERERGRRNF